ncbi:hypothetical protein BC826DRAFT_718071 [Russula brevipes]|nr:hypothetical protein BC826DRAFT_718071 [Russula brevipes]
MTTRKRTDSLDSSLGGKSVRQRTAEPEDRGGQVKTDVEMAAPPAKEAPAGPLAPTSSEASQELADLSAPRSELVKDTTFSDTESENFDQQMQGYILPWKMGGDQIYRANGRFTIIKTIVQLCSGLDRKYVENSGEVDKLLNNNNNTWLPPLLDRCWEKGEFCVIRRLKILRPAPLPTSASREPELSSSATLDSWGEEYRGNAADVLLKTISSYLVQTNAYGASTSILNSSGTGKSRMVVRRESVQIYTDGVNSD